MTKIIERKYPEGGLSGYLAKNQIFILLEHYLKRGETDYLDFKSERIQAKDLAKTIGAMANTNSGAIILGVEEKSEYPWKGTTDIKGCIKKINQIGTNSFGKPLDLKSEIIYLPEVTNPFILVHIPLSSQEIWYNGRYYYRKNDETKIFSGDVTRKIKQHQDDKLIKTLGFTTIFRLLLTYIDLKKEENAEDEIKSIMEIIEAESLSEDVIPKEIASIVSNWNKLKIRTLSKKKEKNENQLKKFIQLSQAAFILQLIFVFGIWCALIFFQSVMFGFNVGVKTNVLIILSFLYLCIATGYFGFLSRFISQSKEETYHKVISPFRFPDVNKMNDLITEQAYEKLNDEIARIIAHMRFHNMTKFLQKSRELLVGYDSNFDPYHPSKAFKEWLGRLDTSLSNEISDEIILKSRIFNIALFFSQSPNKTKIVSDILNISQSDIMKYLDFSPHEKQMILKYDRYYYLFNLEHFVQLNDLDFFWEESQVQFSGFLVGNKVEIIDN